MQHETFRSPSYCGRAWRQEALQGVYGGICKFKLCRGWALLLALLSLLSTAAGESNPCTGDNTFPHLYLNPKKQQNMEHARGTAVWLIPPTHYSIKHLYIPLQYFLIP